MTSTAVAGTENTSVIGVVYSTSIVSSISLAYWTALVVTVSLTRLVDFFCVLRTDIVAKLFQTT